MKADLPKLKELFNFDYQGGGYFRKKGVPKNIPAPIIHGEEAIKYLYNQFENFLKQNQIAKES
jgi:hypothetical protein